MKLYFRCVYPNKPTMHIVPYIQTTQNLLLRTSSNLQKTFSGDYLIATLSLPRLLQEQDMRVKSVSLKWNHEEETLKDVAKPNAATVPTGSLIKQETVSARPRSTVVVVLVKSLSLHLHYFLEEFHKNSLPDDDGTYYPITPPSLVIK